MSHFTLRGLVAVCLLLLSIVVKAQPPGNQPATFTATTTGATSIELEWTPSTGGQLPTHYLIMARVVPAGTFVNPNDGDTPAEDNDLSDDLGAHIEPHTNGPTHIFYTWTGLPPNTDFEFRILPYNNASAGANPRYLFTGAKTATASTKVPSVMLEATSVTGINENSATIHANVVSNHGNPLSEKGVVWSYTSPVTMADNVVPHADGITGAYTIPLTGLNSGVQVFYMAYATSPAGTAVTPEQSFYTFAPFPTKQTAFVTVTGTGTTTIHLDFPSINDNNSGADDFTAGFIILRRAGSAVVDGSVQDGVAPNALNTMGATYVATITNPTQTTYDDSGLTANTNYFYSVVPYNIIGAEFLTINYRVSPGLTNGNGMTFSNSSNIIYNINNVGSPTPYGDHTTSILYAKNANDHPPFGGTQPMSHSNDPNSSTLSLGRFIIQDGGGADADNKPTIVTSISINIPNFENVNAVGLFLDNLSANGNDVLYTGTAQYNITSGTITFTPNTPITVPDDGDVYIVVRAWFRNVVDDNEVMTTSITGATTAATGSSAFAAANAGGATVPNNENVINVVAGRFKLTIPSPGTAPSSINTSFNLLVQAIANNLWPSVDKDYTSMVDLLSDNDHLNPAASLANIPLVAGQYTWTGLSFDAADTYIVTVSDNDHDDNKNDASMTFNIGASASSINASNMTFCYGSTYHELDPITITENDNAGFSTGNNQTFSLILPTGFIFDQTKTTGFSGTGGADIATPSPAYSYPQANVVQVMYNITGTANINSLVLDNLWVAATHPGTMSPAQLSAQPITRFGGTAVIAGDPVGTAHGTLGTVAVGGPTVGFTVAKINAGDVDVEPDETRFSKNGNAVRLSGAPTGGTFYLDPGVTLVGADYRFNPSTLAVSTYTVRYKVTSGGCDYVFSKQFDVYETQITNLSSQYCTNSPASPPLSVSQAVIDATAKTTGYTFTKFEYWSQDAPAGRRDLLPVNGNYIFDPKADQYQSSYVAYGGAYFYWYASNGTNTIGPIYTFVPVKTAPTPSISTANLPANLSFCKDDLPVTLVGVPANSDDAGADHFDAEAGQTASVTSGGTPRVWNFTPGTVAGVSLNTPVFVDLTYTYRNPSTGCSGTSAPITVKVSARPSSVDTDDIIQRLTQQVCQGIPAGTVVAQNYPGTTYNWYNEPTLTTLAGPAGDSFTPTTSTAAAGTTNFYVTRTIDGCESNRETVSPTAATEIELIVNPTPAQPVPDFAREYCVDQALNATDFQITAGTSIKWYKTGDPALLFSGSSPTVGQIQGTGPGLGVSNAAATTYQFSVTQTANGCEGLIDPTQVTITIKPRPVLTLSADADPMTVCKTDPTLLLSAFDQGSPATSATGNGVWTGISAIVGNPANGTAQVNPSLLNPGEYTVQFAFQNTTTQCSSTKTIDLLVLPTIKAKLMPLDSCEKIFVRINNQSTIDMGTLATTPPTIVQTQWSFGDGTGLAPGNGPVDDGRTKNTYFSPEHLFGGTGSFLLQYTMVTSDGCTVSASRQLLISPKPNALFGWRQACMNTISSTEFLAVTNPVLPIFSYAWNFNKNGTLTYTGTPDADNSPTVNYNVTGRDSVQLIVTTNTQCKDTVQHAVFIVPQYPAIDEDNSYTQDFDGGANGWIDGGEASSWAVGKPNETIQTTGAGNFAWDTNLTGTSNAKEQSWVLSPCFDFTQAEKPIISMDIWSDTPLQNDGAVLQYNTNGNILDDNSWTVLGQIGQGANWYDESGISSSPGNQPDTDVGWTGIYGGWKHAAYKLDALKGESSVVFRIAFASNVPRRDGFAFDNVFIGERTRTVLLENFTNSSAAANTKAHNDIFRAFSTSSNEVAKVEYHTAFPGKDPINELNAAINGSRAAFYGLSSTGTFALDGQVAGGAVAVAKIYDDRILTPSPIRLDVTQVEDGTNVRIATTLTNITNQTLPIKDLNVFTVLVEKSITEPSLLGSNDDPEFVYVAKKMLPNAAGVTIGQDLPALSTITMPDVMWEDLGLVTSGQGAIVVFVQSTEGGNKNVVQAKIVDVTVEPDITTGNEQPEQTDGIRVFPNPASGVEITITLPEKAREALPVSLIDSYGRNAQSGAIPKGSAQHTVTTSNLANGFYIVEIETEKGRFVRKKIMVMH